MLWPCFIKIQFENELFYLLSVLLCPKDSKVMIENMLGDKNSCISSPKTDKTTQKYMIFVFLIWKSQYKITHSYKSIVSYIKCFWPTSRESACVIAKPYIKIGLCTFDWQETHQEASLISLSVMHTAQGILVISYVLLKFCACIAFNST